MVEVWQVDFAGSMWPAEFAALAAAALGFGK